MVLSPVSRLVLVLLLGIVVAGCGHGGSEANRGTKFGIWIQNLPKHHVYELNWVERTPRNLALFRVKRLEVGPDGWTATVSFSNTSRQALKLPTGGLRSPKNWGLGVFTTVLSPRIENPGNYLIHAHVTPPLPHVLEPGATWSGTFSSPRPPRSLRYLRVVFGTFFWVGKPPSGLAPFFVWVTSHGVPAPAPQGITATTSG